MEFVHDLIEQWRGEADLLERRGCSRSAETLRSCADDLGARMRAWLHEPLSMQEAAEEVPVSENTLRRMVDRGEMEPVSEGPLRVRRRDVPGRGGDKIDNPPPEDDFERALRRTASSI